MLLHHEFHPCMQQPAQGCLVFIHGLFGSLSNLGMLARAFEQDYDILQLDLRNHGLSGHCDSMSYTEMAEDVLQTVTELGIEKLILIAHSMGGKVAMKLTALAPTRVQGLVVLDIAPVSYQQRHHDHIFTALNAVTQAHLETRQQATELMGEYIAEAGVIPFLLKSFHRGQWRFNVSALEKNYAEIIVWQTQAAWQHPCLFLRGANSAYVAKPEFQQAVQQQFPQATLSTIEDAGHWLHAEQTTAVIAEIQHYLQARVRG